MTLVAELEPNTAVGACSDETVVSFPRTEAAPELAWSQSETIDFEAQHSWRDAWGNAAVLLMVGLVLALVAGVVLWFTRASPEPSTPSVKVSAAPPTVVVPSTTPPPPPPSLTPEQVRDDAFINALHGVVVIHSREQASTGAGWVCAQLLSGRSRPEIASASKAANSDLSDSARATYVDQAVSFYCPQLWK